MLTEGIRLAGELADKAAKAIEKGNPTQDAHSVALSNLGILLVLLEPHIEKAEGR